MEMELQTRTVLRENWLTKPGNSHAREFTLFLLGVLFLGAALYLLDIAGAQKLMSATPHQLFVKKEYWRAFTTIFAHADLGHVLSNTLLFVPFSYFLTRHFGLIFFPVVGLAAATLTNVLVLATMPEHTGLVGASGLVYWMGAAWLTFFWLLDRRDRPAVRLGKAFMVGGVLFVPDVLRPNVSHMAHYVGLLLGVLSASLAYAWNKKTYLAAEVRDHITIAIPDWEGAYKNDQGKDSDTLTLLPGVTMDQFTQVTPVDYKKTSNSN